MALRTAIRVFGILVLSATVARAEMPSGEYAIAIEGDSGLVLPSGQFDQCEDTSEGTLCIASDVDTDASGAVSGSATMTVEGGGISLELALALDGQVSGTTVKPKTALAFTAEGTASDGLLIFDVLGSGKMKCGLDAETPDQLFCKGRMKICAYLAGDKIDCTRLPFGTLLAFEHTPFEIALDLATSEKNAVTGTGEVSIDAVPAFAYTAKGKYKPRTDTTTVKLAGVDRAAKTKITLSKTVLASGSASGGVVTFKIAGQKGKLTLPAP